MIKLLMHYQLKIRIGATLFLTFLILFVFWILSAAIFKPGIIHLNIGSWLVNMSRMESFIIIFLFNLIFGIFGIILLNQWHDNHGLAFGYYFHFFRSSLFLGILNGTNSFTFPFISQKEIFYGFLKVGLWETVSFSLICAATAKHAKYPWNSNQGILSFISLFRRQERNIKEFFVIIFGISFLIFSALMESISIIN